MLEHRKENSLKGYGNKIHDKPTIPFSAMFKKRDKIKSNFALKSSRRELKTVSIWFKYTNNYFNQ